MSSDVYHMNKSPAFHDAIGLPYHLLAALHMCNSKVLQGSILKPTVIEGKT